MDNVRLASLFRRYLDGSCSSDEESELLAYITENDNEETRSLLKGIWNNPVRKLSQSQEQRILQQILLQEINVSGESRHFGWIRIAASIALIGVVALGLYQFYSDKDETIPEIAVAKSDHRFIKLSDGSTVILNEGSTLDYPDAFSGAKREVTLSGEAFFNISHDPGRPFLVRTGQLTTTVLGTSFNVKAYDDQDDITVTVTRGKVSVSDDKNVLGIITPDQQITFHKKTRKAQQDLVSATEVIAWAETDLYFEDVSITDAFARLEERFSVTIEFEEEKVRDCRFTATFVKGEDLNQILDVICEFNNLEYSETETGDIEITGAGCGL